ncbi:MAG: MalY/PatB family protein [Erysipelotrichaceae bacterium]|nr:MalY/PatB family protein [Erysipelotrichaceae bacterium]
MNFNKINDRRNTHSIKWDGHAKMNIPDDCMPLWVADMDFQTVPEVVDALSDLAQRGIYGYSFESDDYFKSVIGWMQRRHQWNIEKEWISTTPGVVSAIHACIQAFTQLGDAVMIQKPVYHPFAHAINVLERKLVNNALILKDAQYVIDFADFEKQIIDNQVKLFILCSPHNPVGRVWTKEELTTMADVCVKHHVLIVSDEIHMDFVFKPYRHHVLVDLNENYRDHVITLTAPSKTFNLAGLKLSNTMIANQKLKKKLEKVYDDLSVHAGHSFGLAATQAAYNHGDAYVDEMVDYLYENLIFMDHFFKENCPKIKIVQPQGLYLVWVDFRELGLKDRELKSFLLTKAKLWLNDGLIFGREGSGFQRINIATPKALIEKALNQLLSALKAENLC